MQATGHCLCGAVSLGAGEAETDMLNFHCVIRRRLTGRSAFTATPILHVAALIVNYGRLPARFSGNSTNKTACTAGLAIACRTEGVA